jgi:L-alanine-DL-glutamate epimerase-like enolase superfamily enzyme
MQGDDDARGPRMTTNPRDVTVEDAAVHFIPVEARMPLKFGAEVMTTVTVLRVRLTVAGSDGSRADGWGETPLSVQWAWPSAAAFSEREACLQEFCVRLAPVWRALRVSGHPMELGDWFLAHALPRLVESLNRERVAAGEEPMPWLAALVCASAFDIALHDAYGVLHGVPTYRTYTAEYMNRDLASYLEPLPDGPSFAGKYPADYFVTETPERLAAWHLVGGADPIDPAELTGSEPDDGYPVLLADWIARDGLRCLKVKLRGNDAAWDYQRLVRVGRMAIDHGVDWLSADFNCMVDEASYVVELLDRLLCEQPRIYGMILYVEQPFGYDLERDRLDVHAISARKPLFMDESAHDWRLVRLGRSLGWTGVALKTCKTQTGALLSLCWAKEHAMTLMVQDLTNPMLAQIPHVLLAAHAGTIMGVETNAMQFYPEASRLEASVHPGLYRRQRGGIDLGSIAGPGFGYRLGEIGRSLPVPAA